jgi:hypothetical protein
MNIEIKRILSPLKLLLIGSLLVNIIFVPRTLTYERYINDELRRVIRGMESSIEECLETLSQIERTKEINVRQYGSLKYEYEDVEDRMNDLSRFVYNFKGTTDQYIHMNEIFDIDDYLYEFGTTKKLLKDKKLQYEGQTMALSADEIEKFKKIHKKTITYKNIIEQHLPQRREDADRFYSVRKDEWALVFKDIYEYSANNTTR